MATNLILESYQDLVETYNEIARLQLELDRQAPASLMYKIHSRALEAAEAKFLAIIDNQVDSRLLELMDMARGSLTRDMEKRLARQVQLVAQVL